MHIEVLLVGVFINAVGNALTVAEIAKLNVGFVQSFERIWMVPLFTPADPTLKVTGKVAVPKAATVEGYVPTLKLVAPAILILPI